MAIEFTELVEPTQLTTALSILIVSILSITAYVAYLLDVNRYRYDFDVYRRLAVYLFLDYGNCRRYIYSY